MISRFRHEHAFKTYYIAHLHTYRGNCSREKDRFTIKGERSLRQLLLSLPMHHLNNGIVCYNRSLKRRTQQRKSESATIEIRTRFEMTCKRLFVRARLVCREINAGKSFCYQSRADHHIEFAVVLSFALRQTLAIEHRMAGKQAKILNDGHVQDLLVYASHSRHPVRNRAIVLLSVKAGLRAGEIAALTWEMVLGADGAIGQTLDLHDRAAKKRHGRRIPIHADLRQSLFELCCLSPAVGPIIKSERGGRMSAASIVLWFIRAYRALGLTGCSSHSGRRTFVTRAARAVHHAGGSLRDVQLLAGHSSIQTTQRYIDGDTDAQRRLVALI